ncbi:hypothetical protein HYU19_03975 [Candidatus Woesearchaeota archaeon]|nr:hypothetical protein [Candidatus Woesearchaeota archaeon]
MGLKEVEEDILKRTENEARAILQQAQRDADAILEDARCKAGEYKLRAEASAKALLAMMEKREKAAADFDLRKALLDKKKSIIDSAVDKARQEIASLPEKKREGYILALIRKSQQEIDVARVIASKKDKKAVSSAKGVSYEEGSMSGGIIAETSDGKIRVDYQYDEILHDIKDRSLQQLGKILF